MTQLLHPSPEVQEALASDVAVVALESTIITHGMPRPTNLETAIAVEAAIREQGAVPATVAVIDGRLKVGLTDSELERLATAKNALKASSRDLAAVIMTGCTAGTTISATMRAADLAGIDVLATGGSGGVHRGAETTFDISSDLTELAHTGTAIFCAGVKSILDIGKTLEYLETHRIPVIAYQTHEFPAFFTRESGFRVDHRLESPEDVANIIEIHRMLASGTGLLIVNPIPAPDALNSNYSVELIDNAVAEADRRGISQKELTPFLLEQVNSLSDGMSLNANVALIKNNATLAARSAVVLAARKKSQPEALQ